eukprot:1553175-Lingulodinium_polyedra.AAC.1
MFSAVSRSHHRARTPTFEAAMARADASQRRFRPQRTASFGVLHGARPSGRWRAQLHEAFIYCAHDCEA